MSLGYQYAERREAAGVLDAHFGQYRRMHWPGWRPSQVRGVTSMARLLSLSHCKCSVKGFSSNTQSLRKMRSQILLGGGLTATA